MDLSKSPFQHDISPRSVVIGLVCVVLFCIVVPYNDFLIEGTFLAGNHFPIGSVFLLMLTLLLVNPVLKVIRHKWMLSETELITIWCMMLVSIGIPTVGLARWLFPLLVGFRYFATPENDWQTLFGPYFSNWLAPVDSDAVRFFYEKNPEGMPIPYFSWIKPLIFWMGVIGGLWLLMITLSVIFRRQWIEREKYIFPLAELPNEMVSPPASVNYFNSFFKNRLLWVGFSIPVLVHACNGLHFYFPSFPILPLKLRLDPYLSEKPWSAVLPLWLYLFPSMIGFTYLIRLDVALSIWAFFLLYRLQLVIGTAFAIPMERSMGYGSRAYASHMEMGGYIVSVIYFVWVGRHHLLRMLGTFFSRKKLDPSEPISEPWILPCLLLGILIPSILLHLAGASLVLCFGVVVLMGISSIMLTYMVIAGGILHINSSFRAFDLYYTALGSGGIGRNNLSVLTIPAAIFRTKRGFLMPHVSNIFKMADTAKVNGKQLLMSIVLALTLAVGLTCITFLWIVYRTGALNMQHWTFVTAPQTPFRWLETQFQLPTETNWVNLGFIGVGAIIMTGLYWIRNNFIWWPLHPIGFVSSPGEWPLNNLWFSIFIGWLVKSTLLKYGGLKQFRQAKPFFFGLVLGDCFIGGVWAVFGMIVGDGYTMLPG